MATTNKQLREHLAVLAEALYYDPSCDWCTSGNYHEAHAPPARHPEGCAMKVAVQYQEV